MQEYIEKRVMEISNYIIESGSTVRQTANVFGVSKSTVHIVVTKEKAFLQLYSKEQKNQTTKSGLVLLYFILRWYSYSFM